MTAGRYGEEKLVTQAEAARRLGMHYQSVWRAIQRGRIATVEVAGIALVPVDEIKRYRRTKVTHRPRTRTKRRAT